MDDGVGGDADTVGSAEGGGVGDDDGRREVDGGFGDFDSGGACFGGHRGLWVFSVGGRLKGWDVRALLQGDTRVVLRWERFTVTQAT